MERRRIPHERERWLSAVLIVAAIAGVSVAVPLWPLAVPPVPPRAAHLLPARALPLVGLPLALTPNSPSVVRLAVRPVITAPAAPQTADAPVAVVAVAERGPTTSPRASAPPADDPREESVDDVPVLASRRVELPLSVPSADEPVLMASSSSSLAFVELPAVAVTRVVVVAGRGIRTGLRATGAAFRAAF